jgi:two-component system chemotaxis response regulator CheY
MEKLILFVDDSPTMRSSVSFCLRNAGYRVTEAEDGQDGLVKLQSIKDEGESVALIITDINMPKMDGIAFILKVKETSLFNPNSSCGQSKKSCGQNERTGRNLTDFFLRDG